MPSIFTLEIVERARMKTAGDLLTASPRGWGKRGDMFFRRFAFVLVLCVRSSALALFACSSIFEKKKKTTSCTG